MHSHTKEKISYSPVGLVPHNSRQPSGSAAMRKYQQLALSVIAGISLIAFVFYKHEYERLKYTLEYLETFGEPPSSGNIMPQCGLSVHETIATPPVEWTEVSSDLTVYSAFWDDHGSLAAPQVCTLAIIKKSSIPPTNVKAVLWYDGSDVLVSASCVLHEVKERVHGIKALDVNNVHFVNLFCKADDAVSYRNKVPYVIQFLLETGDHSLPVLIHENQSFKTVVNQSAICVVPSQSPTNTLKLVEFVAFHNIIGIDKFVFYGPILTPLARRLLDKYGDEVGLSYEEKGFNLPESFSMNTHSVKSIIEFDCIHRLRDSHENVIVLLENEYLIPQHKSSLPEVLEAITAVGGKAQRLISEFHLSTQQVCIDSLHDNHAELLLSKQARINGKAEERGSLIIRPSLQMASNDLLRVETPTRQHISAGILVIQQYTVCNNDGSHLDDTHLAASRKFTGLLEKSLLFRKWKISS